MLDIIPYYCTVITFSTCFNDSGIICLNDVNKLGLDYFSCTEIGKAYPQQAVYVLSLSCSWNSDLKGFSVWSDDVVRASNWTKALSASHRTDLQVASYKPSPVRNHLVSFTSNSTLQYRTNIIYRWVQTICINFFNYLRFILNN